jgi:hypothetical protein
MAGTDGIGQSPGAIGRAIANSAEICDDKFPVGKNRRRNAFQNCRDLLPGFWCGISRHADRGTTGHAKAKKQNPKAPPH